MKETLVSHRDKCPLCKNSAHWGEQKDAVYEVRCGCCGTFDIGTMAARQLEEGVNSRLCAWVRQQHDLGERPCFRGDAAIKELKERLVVPSIAEKKQKLLRWVAGKSKFPGDRVEIFPKRDWPVAWCAGSVEFEFHYNELVRDKLLEEATYDCAGFPVLLTGDGWKKLEASGDAVEPDLVFVAMWFDTTTDDVWNRGFRKGITDAGYRAHRVDQEPHVERIDMKLLSDIRRSRIVVADATGVRANVYYEAGYAEALGRPVIWTVREDYKDKKQFDTRQFRHIVWKDSSDLAKQLEDFIGGIAGRRKLSNG